MATAEMVPSYMVDESKKEGYVHIKLKIDGLKVESPGYFQKFMHRHPHPKGRNAVIELPFFTSRSVELHVKGETGEMKGAQYGFQIQRLPYSINEDECYITAQEGWIHIFLKKRDVSQSWEEYLREDNLETVAID